MARRPHLERADSMIRLGLQLWANEERQEAYQEEKKATRAEREEVRAESKRRWDVQEERQTKLGEYKEEEFEWAKEDRKKQKDYEVIKKKLDVADALFKAGNTRGAAAGLQSLLNIDYPDGNEYRIVFRDDAFTDPNGRKAWENNPNLAGKEIAVFSKKEGLLPFNSMKEVMRYAAANLNYGNYIKDANESEAKVADANARETPFTTESGDVMINTWVLGSGGNLKRGEAIPFEGDVPAKKRTGLDLKAKEAETVLGRPLTPKEKKVTLGLAEKEKKKAPDISKQRKADKDALDLLLRRFVDKSGKKDALSEFLGEGEEVSLTGAGKNAIDTALTLAEKADAGEPLTPKEKRNLPYARRVQKVYSQISGKITEEYAGEPQRKRTKLSSSEESKFQSWYKSWAKKTGINSNPDDPGHKYDYRAAYMAGVKPTISSEDGSYHWPSKFKDSDHPNRFVGGVDTTEGMGWSAYDTEGSSTPPLRYGLVPSHRAPTLGNQRASQGY